MGSLKKLVGSMNIKKKFKEKGKVKMKLFRM